MAVSLTPTGLTGDKLGEFVSDTNFTGNTVADLMIDLPSASTYDWVRIYFTITGSNYQTAGRGRLFCTVYNTSNTRLNCENNVHQASNSGTHNLNYYSSSNYVELADYADMSSHLSGFVDIELSGVRPAIIGTMNYTWGNVGSTRVDWSMHFTTTTTYGKFGFNVDDSGGPGPVEITGLKARIIGYRNVS